MLFCTLSLACGPAERGAAQRFESDATGPSCKPEAPVELVLEGRSRGGRLYEVVAVVTSEVDVQSVSIHWLDGPGVGSIRTADVRIGALAPFVPTRVATVVELEESGAEIYASAHVEVDGIKQKRLAALSLGSGFLRKPQNVSVIHAPDGQVIEEVVP